MAGEANIWQPRTVSQLSADTKAAEERLVAIAGQFLFTLQDFTYVPGTGSLTVHKNGHLLSKGVDWAEQTESTFSVTKACTVGDVVVASGLTAVTGEVCVGVTDIYAANYQALRDYAGDEVTLYAESQSVPGDGGAFFYQLFTGAGAGFYVDNNGTIIVPTGGNGSAAWIRVDITAIVSISDLSIPYEFATRTAMVASILVFPVGKVLITAGQAASNDGGGFEYIVTAGSSSDTESNPNLVGGGHAKLKVLTYVPALSYIPAAAGLLAALNLSVSGKNPVDLGGGTITLLANVQMPVGSEIQNGNLVLGVGITFRMDAAVLIDRLNIDANGADYGLLEKTTISVTDGSKYSIVKDLDIVNAAVSDIRLAGYHFLLEIDGVRCLSTGTGYGMNIDNIDGNSNPDVIINRCYVNGPDKGFKLDDGHYLVTACSADGCTIPFANNNAFVKYDICGFEQFNTSAQVSSSQIELNKCIMSTQSGAFVDDSGQRAMVTVSGGPIDGSCVMNGGICQNSSTIDDVYKMRASSVTPPEYCLISNDVESRSVGGKLLLDFIYQSIGSPSITAARVCHLGINSEAYVFSGLDLVGTTVFDMDVSPLNHQLPIAAKSTVRHIHWKEIGSNVAGATTKVDCVLYDEDGVELDRQADVISIPGIGSSTAPADKRFGSTIIDMVAEPTEYVEFEVATAGQRINTGFALTAVIDRS